MRGGDRVVRVVGALWAAEDVLPPGADFGSWRDGDCGGGGEGAGVAGYRGGGHVLHGLRGLVRLGERAAQAGVGPVRC